MSALLIPAGEWWLTLAHGLAAPRSVEMDWPARVCAWPEELPGADEIAEMGTCSWPKLYSLVIAHRRQDTYRASAIVTRTERRTVRVYMIRTDVRECEATRRDIFESESWQNVGPA